MTTNQATGKIKASRVNNLAADTYVGPAGQIWYDVDTGLLRLGDNVTPGGTIIGGGSGNGVPGGPTNAIQFNDGAGFFGGNIALTYDSANSALISTGNVVANAVLTDNYLYANGQPFTPGTNYSNANVASYLSSGNVTTDIVTSANVVANTSVSSNVVVALNGLFLNANTIPESYTVPAGYNAFSSGPMVVPDNVVVTVGDGQRWTSV